MLGEDVRCPAEHLTWRRCCCECQTFSFWAWIKNIDWFALHQLPPLSVQREEVWLMNCCASSYGEDAYGRQFFEARSCWLPAGPTPVSRSELRAKKSTKNRWLEKDVWHVRVSSDDGWDGGWSRLLKVAPGDPDGGQDLTLSSWNLLDWEGGRLCFCTWDRCWGASSSAAFISVEMRACVWIRRHSALSTQPHKSDLLVCFWGGGGCQVVIKTHAFCSHANTKAFGRHTAPSLKGLLCLAVVTSD